jgi:hypothetical protein
LLKIRDSLWGKHRRGLTATVNDGGRIFLKASDKTIGAQHALSILKMVSEYTLSWSADQLPSKRYFALKNPELLHSAEDNLEVPATGAKRSKPSQGDDYVSRYGKWLELQLEDRGMQLDTDSWKV